MKVFKLDDMVRGWFVGNFDPTCHKTSEFEVNFRTHVAGEYWELHYHTDSIEVNLVTSGKMSFNGTILEAGTIFIVESWQISDPIFLEDTSVVCIRIPSRNDKVVVTRSINS